MISGRDEGMALPVDVDPSGWKIIAIGALSLLQAIGFLGMKFFRDEQKDHGDRLNALEKSYVTRAELDQHVQRLEAASIRKHVENREALERIESKIEHSSETRHEIRDSVHATQMMIRAWLKHGRLDEE